MEKRVWGIDQGTALHTSLVVSVPALIKAVIASSIPPQKKMVWGTAHPKLVTMVFHFCVVEANEYFINMFISCAHIPGHGTNSRCAVPQTIFCGGIFFLQRAIGNKTSSEP